MNSDGSKIFLLTDLLEVDDRDIFSFIKCIVESANVWLLIIDVNGRVALWNRAAERISGYDRSEVLGKKDLWEKLFPNPEYREEILRVGRDMVQNDRRLEHYESTITRKDGERRTIDWSSRPLKNSTGKRVGSLSIGVDITDEKTALKDLEEVRGEVEETVASRTRTLTRRVKQREGA